MISDIKYRNEKYRNIEMSPPDIFPPIKIFIISHTGPTLQTTPHLAGWSNIYQSIILKTFCFFCWNIFKRTVWLLVFCGSCREGESELLIFFRSLGAQWKIFCILLQKCLAHLCVQQCTIVIWFCKHWDNIYDQITWLQISCSEITCSKIKSERYEVEGLWR